MTHKDPEPFEVILLVFILVGLTVQFFSSSPPGIVERVLGHQLILAWSLLFIAGPIVTLVGIFWPGRVSTSWTIEQAGLIAVAGVSLIYVTVLATQFGKTDGVFIPTAFVAGYGIASIWRIVRIFMMQREVIRRSKILNGEVE